MDWLGIGVLIIGLAFLILVMFLMKPLRKLSNVLESIQQTTDGLPKTLTDITDQTTAVLHSGNEAIEHANDQVKEISPLFHIVGDAGEASRELTSAMLDKTIAFKQSTSEATEFAHRKKYEGLYGLLSLSFYLFQKKEEIKQAVPRSEAK